MSAQPHSPEQSQTRRPGHSDSRLVKACNRCSERKIKCDGLAPKCGPCGRSGYSGCNVSEYVMYTYGHVEYLKKRIAWLEELVGATYEDGELIQGVPTGSTLLPMGTNVVKSEPFVEEVGVLSLRGLGSYVGSMSGVTLTRLISSAIRLYGEDINATMDIEASPHNPITRAPYPTRTLAVEYVKAYISRVHRWYPFLDLASLASSLSSVYSRHSYLSDTARLTLMMVFALGSGSRGSVDPFTSEDYFVSACNFLSAALAVENLDAVRTLMLLCMYGLRSWRRPGKYSVNVWLVVGHALRMGVGLGISRNKYSFGEENESSRKVWWSVYAVERYVATGLSRVLGIRNTAIDAHLPRAAHEVIPPDLMAFLGMDTGGSLDLNPARALYRQRSLLGDIQETIYVALPRDGPPTLTLEEMSTRILDLQAKLVNWANDIQGLTPPNSTEQDVLQLAFHHATLLLHRPCPSFPVPSLEALDLSMGAARGTIRICGSAVRNNAVDEVMPGWPGFLEVFMSGLTLMYCSITGSACPQAIRNPSTDSDLLLGLEILDHLATLEPSAKRYVQLFRQVITQMGKILPSSTFDFLKPQAVEQVAEDSGLWSFEGLELDQDAIELVTRILLSTTQSQA